MDARESGVAQRLQRPEFLERMIALNTDRDQQANLWHNAAAMFEADIEYADRWDQAIRCYQKGLNLLVPNDERRAMFLSHLGDAFMGRAESGVTRKLDIELAIEAHIKALDLTPKEYPYHFMFVANYGDAMMKLYYESRSQADFQKGVELLKTALEYTKHNDPNRKDLYTKLRDELYFRSEDTGEVKDLSNALDMHREDEPYNLEPAGRYQLAVLLQKRHLSSGSMLDLNEALTIMDELLIDCPADDVHYGMILNCLGRLLHIRARRSDLKQAIADCDRSIELQERALKRMEDNQLDTPETRAIFLSSLGSVSHANENSCH